MVNRLKKLPPRFQEVLKASSSLAGSLGFNIYLVGGVVRDLILARAIFDLDIVVEGEAIVFASHLAKRIGGSFKKHHAFGTATVYFNEHKIDFATARVEKYPHWGALPRIKPAALSQDLFRRDFTINAMAISLNKNNYGRLIDLYNGAQDLGKKLIRVLHKDSFLEDPTRILRAVRFEQRFNFIIEANTFRLMDEALSAKALKLVSPHRLREELILILKEPAPRRYIKRINELEKFSFLDPKLDFKEENFRFFLRIEKAVLRYQKKIRKNMSQVWLMYLAGILINLPLKKIIKVFHDFGFRKREREMVISLKKNIHKIKKLDKNIKPETVYHILKPYALESIIFFYAYYPRKILRKNIDHFLDKLTDISLKVKGEDLKSFGLKPLTLYSKLLQKLLYAKIAKGLKSKKEEKKELKRIFRRLTHREKG